jgi:hypothetical protein
MLGGRIDGKGNSVDGEERSDYYRRGGNPQTVAHRQGVGGSDEGLFFEITTAGSEQEGKRILRFDCFYKTRIITSAPPENILFTT